MDISDVVVEKPKKKDKMGASMRRKLAVDEYANETNKSGYRLI